jgi:hypothetical protein
MPFTQYEPIPFLPPRQLGVYPHEMKIKVDDYIHAGKSGPEVAGISHGYHAQYVFSYLYGYTAQF